MQGIREKREIVVRPMKRRDLRRSFGRRLKGVADQDRWFPFVEKRRAEVVVKVDGWLVPVQDFPAHAEIFFPPGDSGDVFQQRRADAALARRGANKEIVQKQTGAPLKRGIELEEHGVPDRFAVPLRDHGAEFGAVAETVAEWPPK